MLKNYKKVVSFLTLSLFLLLVLIITSPVQAEMGRARIENNTMVTGDGARLRGGSLWVINNDNLMYKAEWALGDGPWEYINEYKLNSVRVACGYRPDNPDDNFTLDEYEQMLDQIIDRAEQEEIYVIISLRPGGSYKMDAAREFWGSIASRYKDRENVIYELVNAPVGKSNPARYSDDVLRDMEELWGLCDEKAPDTPLIIQSYYTVGESGAYPAEVADNLQGIDWDKTAVGFQSFKIDKSDRIIDLKNKYPCINTEFWFWTTDDEDGEMRPIDGYDRHSTLMEELGISWFGWNIIDRESSRDGLELLVFDALENGVYWDEIKPYIIEQSLDQYVREGTDVSFSAKVYGVPEVEYQWYFNDNAIPGETSSTLKLNNVTNINEGIYTFKVSNYLGSLTSEPAKLELIEEVSFSRPYISDGTLVTGNGSRIRGGTFWLYGNNSDLRSKTDWALSDKPWETMKKYGFNTVRIACGFPSGKYDIYHYEHYLDRLITRAEKEGIYVIVSFRPDTTGSYKMEDARKFWSRIADRYKDRENTIYELVNAPAADLANYTADLLADMEELWEICNNTAPDTPLIILSYDTLGTSGIGQVEVADNLEGRDWSKTAVGFHSFKIDQSDRIVDLINSKYPCINTEFWYHNRRKVMLQIDGYSSHAALMENLETSWLCWDILDTEASLEGLKYTIFDLTDNQVYWNDIEPYILEQSLDQYLREGKNVTFSVKSYGWPQPEFQWFHNGEEISEANASELILDNVTSADEGMYTVELTNNLGTVNSEPAKLELIEEVSLKRPYISNGTLVDGNGNRLRGGTLWIYGSNKLGYKTDWALSDDPWNAMKEAKFNAVRIACGYRPELLTTEGNYDLYQYENYLDRLIARAEKEGIYA
ncbi:MAG: cellulase family glycosylhydrolase, partial [Halanaerobiales bacterium]